MVRLTRRKGKLPRSTISRCLIHARKLRRLPISASPRTDAEATRWLREVSNARRHGALLKEVLRGEALVVLVPVARGLCPPRLDEALRLIGGLSLAARLRKRVAGSVVTALWPIEGLGPGVSAIIQRDGQFEDASFRGGDAKAYVAHLRDLLPGTGFSPWLLDRLSRAAHSDPDVFKARLLLEWFDDEYLTCLPPGLAAPDGASLLRAVAVIGDGPDAGTLTAGQPILLPAPSATMIEGKVEGWLRKFGLSPEAVLAAEVLMDRAARSGLPEDAGQVVSRGKERVLSALLRFEMGLNDLGFRPEADLRRALTGLDIAFDRLRGRARTESEREVETGLRQLARLHQYLLPEGRPQPEVMSLVHYLDFYGPEFVTRLREALPDDELRHLAVYLAEGGDSA
jgi:hypothetical protein